MGALTENIIQSLDKIETAAYYGRVSAVQGLFVEVSGILSPLAIGDRCNILNNRNEKVPCEIVSFKDDKILLMPYGSMDGIGINCLVEVLDAKPVIYPHVSWLGRIVNAFGEAIDGKGPLIKGNKPYFIKSSPPPAQFRDRVKGKVDLGIKAVNAFLTICKGQRMGIFAGSGVGKSTLMSMMARQTDSDVSVIGLIGERGREAKEFIEDVLGEEGLKKSVLVLATSDESPLLRRQAAYVTMAVSEYFRDENKNVLCMMDSITRFAMAQREIALSVGEPPASKGYTPSVFSELPKLLERAGPGAGNGTITGLFTVLVDGDDHNEPVADAVRSILDGHIVLDRAIAERNRYPAINILRSVSRTMPDCDTKEEAALVSKARKYIASYEDMAELIRLGAYKKGSNREVDEAIFYYPMLEDFLAQGKQERFSLAECYELLAEILNTPYVPEG
ncbi:MAG: flagellar protein export ATPase FliI [bacterium]|nr:flagellar protein export ATPase FliI [bacterium]MDY2830756.1 flagellar protein export ATPase FliI [Alphaproteobacteria bacterium]